MSVEWMKNNEHAKETNMITILSLVVAAVAAVVAEELRVKAVERKRAASNRRHGLTRGW